MSICTTMMNNHFVQQRLRTHENRAICMTHIWMLRQADQETDGAFTDSMQADVVAVLAWERFKIGVLEECNGRCNCGYKGRGRVTHIPLGPLVGWENTGQETHSVPRTEATMPRLHEHAWPLRRTSVRHHVTVMIFDKIFAKV